MPIQPLLSPDLIGTIALYSGDIVVLDTLKHYMTPAIYQRGYMTPRNYLIYGQIQSGKTAAIFEIAALPKYAAHKKIIVMQNSTLVLRQYIQRFKDIGIFRRVQVIDSKTTQMRDDKDILLLVNNTHRYKHLLRINQNHTQPFVLILDEADLCANHPITKNPHVWHTYYVTATPKTKRLPNDMFHGVGKVPVDPTYQGLDQLRIQYEPQSNLDYPEKPVREYVQSATETDTMMLVTTFFYAHEIRMRAIEWSKKYPHIPIVIMTSQKSILLAGTEKRIGKRPVQTIIDSLSHHPKIIFMANRLANRGLSYVSSDYKRHLTHQVSSFYTTPVTNALQKLRILGKYQDQAPLTLILPANNETKIEKMFQAINYQMGKQCRDFVCNDIYL